MNGKHRVSVHHLADSAVVVFFHSASVRIDCLQQLSILLGIIRLAVTAESPALHEMQQNASEIQFCHCTIQRLHAQSVNVRQVSCLHRLFDFFFSRQVIFAHQLIQISFAQVTPSQSAACAAGFAAWCGKALASFRLFCSVKYPRATANQAIGLRILIQRHHCPAHGRNTNIQTNSIGMLHHAHILSPFLLSYRITSLLTTDDLNENLTKKMTPCHLAGRQSFTVP